MHTSTLVASMCTLSLKAFCRYIKHEGNALNAARSTLFHICSHLEKCISIKESPNLYMDGKNAYLEPCDLNMYFITILSVFKT